MPQILLQNHSVLTLYLQVNTVICHNKFTTLCFTLSCLGCQSNRACFIIPINWVNWLILISCFLKLMRDSASLGKHIILQEDQKQRKPDNKSLGFQGMFTGKLSVFWPELRQTTGFVSLPILEFTVQMTQETQAKLSFFWHKLHSVEYKSACFVWEDKKFQK